jgi:DegV family protein with EDD domain
VNLSNHIAIVTESTSCIPKDLAQKYHIQIVPLVIVWDKIQYRDGVDMDPAEFYKRLRQATTNLPTTTSAVQGGFLEVYQKLLGQVDGAVTITLSKRIPSAGYDSAVVAGQMVPDLPLEVVDSNMAGGGLGLVVLAAARKAAAGASLQEVAAAARLAIPKMQVYWMQQSIDYILRLARVRMTPDELAEWKNYLPIMTFRDGKMVPFEKQPTKQAALERMVQMIQENYQPDSRLHVVVMNSDDPAGFEDLQKMVKQRYKVDEMILTEFPPVMGAHYGPGVLGLSFYYE